MLFSTAERSQWGKSRGVMCWVSVPGGVDSKHLEYGGVRRTVWVNAS